MYKRFASLAQKQIASDLADNAEDIIHQGVEARGRQQMNNEWDTVKPRFMAGKGMNLGVLGRGYIKHGLHITPEQQHRLVTGERVLLKHGQLGFQTKKRRHVPVHLTKAQITKLMDAHDGKQSAYLKFTPKQTEMHGQGWFSNAWDKIKSAGRQLVNLAKPIVKNLGRSAVEYATPIIQDQLIPGVKDYAQNIFENQVRPALIQKGSEVSDRVIGHVKNRIDTGVNSGLEAVNNAGDRLANTLTGNGFSRIPRGARGARGGAQYQKGMGGCGFFGDLWSGVKSVANTAVPIVTNQIVKRVTGMGVNGKGKKRRGRGMAKIRGDGFFDDVWSGVKSVAAPLAPLAAAALIRRAGGGGVRGKGKGLYASAGRP